MDIQKKYRWALTGLIIMILLNAATLVTIWINQPDGKDWRKHRDQEHKSDSIQEYMKEELGITDQQAENIIEVRREHYREIRMFRDSLEQHRRAYFKFIMSEDAEDQAKRDSVLNLLTDQYENIEGLLYSHMTEINKLLNDEQKSRFEEMMLRTYFKDQGDRQDRNKRKKDQ